jgi:hypothetical protein
MAVMISQTQQKTSGMVVFLSLSNNTEWVLDSGSTDHLTGNKNLLMDFHLTGKYYICDVLE